jgi:hypothetical protein
MDQAEVFGKLIAAGRHWVQARMTHRRLLDSKSAKPEDVKKSERLVIAAAAQLERAVMNFDRVVQMPRRAKKAPLDLAKLAGAVASIAGGIEKAAQSRRGGVIDAEIIDVDGQSVR